MTKIREREIATQLRRGGASVGEISRKLNVSKSTISHWCRDIILSEKQISEVARRSKHHSTEALLRFAEKRRIKRNNDTKYQQMLGRKDVATLKKRDIFMIGLGLYWGEGYKRGSQELGFTNSDPNMIRFYIIWLKVCYSIPSERLVLRVSINAQHTFRIRQVEKYWSELTGIPLSQFTKSSLIKTASQKQYQNHQEHFGTLRIKVRRGTNTRRRILGSIDALLPK